MKKIISELFNSFIKENHAPNIELAVFKGTQLVALESFHKINQELYKTAGQNQYRIASMTKSFAAVAILKLQNSGFLKLSDKVSSFLPEMKLDKKWEEVTLLNLLSMTSGLPEDNDWADPFLDEDSNFVCEELLNNVVFEAAVNSTYVYSNLGYMILGRIISNLSGVSALTFIQDELLKPLDMSLSSWNSDSLVQSYKK